MKQSLSELLEQYYLPSSYDEFPLSINVLQGQKIKATYRDGDELYFLTDYNDLYVMMHAQECCETVWINSIDGDLESLEGEVVIVSEEACQHESENPEVNTWTFYRLRTNLSTVVIRWAGTSNGYYSEKVGLYMLVDKSVPYRNVASMMKQ